MRIKDGYMLQTVAGSNIVVPVGEGELSFRGMLTLNEVGALVWRALESGSAPEEIASQIVKEYSVDEQTALRDVNAYIEKLRSINVIED